MILRMMILDDDGLGDVVFLIYDLMWEQTT